MWLARIGFALLALLAAGILPTGRAEAMSAHDFTFRAIEGGELPLGSFRGKAVLVVNTASQCGFTPQYAGLQELWRRYRERGLVVLGVPSNDFGGQEPGSAAEIKAFCEVNFDVDFPLTDKQRVIGADAHPFYRWIARELGEGQLPRWNFHKYLVAPDGSLAGTFPTRVRPDAPELIRAIEEVLPASR
ncbi:MAG: glutathione peroxidase [Alphaproteobacteria bacterium]|nr:glutathione peroxidase [Alphaproteobacteria bacterium]